MILPLFFTKEGAFDCGDPRGCLISQVEAGLPRDILDLHIRVWRDRGINPLLKKRGRGKWGYW